MIQSTPLQKNKRMLIPHILRLGLLIWSLPNLVWAAFMLEGNVVHPGCVMGLVPKANGDWLVEEVLLKTSIPYLRGCQDSNQYSNVEVHVANGLVKMLLPGHGGDFTYRVVKDFGGEVYLLAAGSNTGGSYTSSNYILVALKKRKIASGKWGALQKYDVVKLKALAYLDEVPTQEALQGLTQGQILKETHG